MPKRPFFFGLHLNSGAKFWTEKELLCLTKLCKQISPPQNLLYQQKIEAYAGLHKKSVAEKENQ